ncbi:MAG TPA: hypothetical protein VEP90_15995, partial [Methylomirabilota bacterium]|nr:hypothetical protein [Methylomirabilota bacterium]
MKRFLSYIEEIRKQKKLTRTQISLAAFGILLFLSLALTLPTYLLKEQQILRSQAQEAQAPIEMGVNLAGADFCDTFPCTYGTNYIYPN